ncbi:HEAT repeat domain-containing protein [Streptomyces sp. NPDC001970]
MLLALVRDPDPEVRGSVGRTLGTWYDLTPEVSAALLSLVRDPHAGVRGAAAEVLAASPDRTRAVTEALPAPLDEDDQLVRPEAAFGLTRRDDPRTEAAFARVGPLGRGFEDDHRPGELFRWRWRREDGSATAEQ